MNHATFNPGFPVHIYEEGMELPKEGTYFLVSGNGLWLHKDTGIVRAFVPVDNISVLQSLDAEAWVDCQLPKLPAKYVWQIKTFFKKVVERYRSEATTTLYYSKEKKEFKIHIPQQRVSHAGVVYRRTAMTGLEGLESYLPVMTIHSHCDFGAFHSGTDIGDEEDFDGVHCTFGHNDKDEFTISASVVVNGRRLSVDPSKVLEGIELVREEKTTTFWSQKAKITRTFRLTDTDVTWEEPIERWFDSVQHHVLPELMKAYETDEIEEGDRVVWAGEHTVSSFRKMSGDGPFRVHSVEDGKVTIGTKVGLASFSEKLFKKAEK
jgi:hypothetical protein